MRTVFRFLKPYWLSVVLVIALLFVQANADLALPDYLSRIVNIGIQQNGIEADLPPVLRASTFEAMESSCSRRAQATSLSRCSESILW